MTEYELKENMKMKWELSNCKVTINIKKASAKFITFKVLLEYTDGTVATCENERRKIKSDLLWTDAAYIGLIQDKSIPVYKHIWLFLHKGEVIE